MKLAIFGTGYVGLVTAACLADVGHEVIAVDIDAQRVAALQQGHIPIYEPGLEPLVTGSQSAGRLRFTTDAAEALRAAEVAFIAVGTPPEEDGSADLRHVLAVARVIGQTITRPLVVVNKSTVPVGTADRVRTVILNALAVRGQQVDVEVVSNPEFLKEGSAVKDCMRPDRILIGSRSERAIACMRQLYGAFNRNHDRILVMDERSAELTKYAANAMLATKISFMNEMANIAECVGADIEQVRHGIGSDSRIGYSFIYAGAGYGGSCFPKDVKALAHAAGAQGYTPCVLQAVEAVNATQKRKLSDLVLRHYGGNIAGKTFAVWGLSFKPNTDDMREAPSRNVLSALWTAGAHVRVFDPAALNEARRVFGTRDDLVYCEDQAEAVRGADALIVVTEWRTFWSPDFARLREQLSDAVVFDGRNIYEPDSVERAGLAYYGIGRGRSVHRVDAVAHQAGRDALRIEQVLAEVFARNVATLDRRQQDVEAV